MNILDRAIIFATKAHSGMHRKGTSIPYITHPLEAVAIASTLTTDLEVLAAAVLHDVIEDTPISLEALKKEFGDKAANLVYFDTEDKMSALPAQDTWLSRKQSTFNLLDNSNEQEQIIVLADKLSNMRAIYRDYNIIGEKLWERFNQKDKEKHKWYYKGIADRLVLLKNTFAYKEYSNLIEKVFEK